MKKAKQFLAMMLAAALTAGSLQSGVYAAQTGRAGQPATTNAAQVSSGFAADDAVRTYSQTYQTKELPVSAALMDADNFTSDPSASAASMDLSGFSDAAPVPGVETFLNRSGSFFQLSQDESSTDAIIEEETDSASDSSQDDEDFQYIDNTDNAEQTQNPSNIQEEMDSSTASPSQADESTEDADQESSEVVSDESTVEGTEDETHEHEIEDISSDNTSENTDVPVSEDAASQKTEESSDQKDQDLHEESGAADTEEDTEEIVKTPENEADSTKEYDVSDSKSSADESALTENEDTVNGETSSDNASNGAEDSTTELTPQTLSSDLVINGDAVISKSGIIDLNGHTLTITGSLLQSNATLIISSGSLEVGGDYRIQRKNSGGSYDYSYGALVMKDDADRVTVGGDFYPSGYSSYYYEEGSRVDGDVFTAGVLKIGGSLYQSKRSGSFCSSGTHRVVLTGTGERTILISSPDSHVNSLYVPDEISLTWEGYLNMDKPEVDLEVKASENGLSLYRNGFDDGVMDFNGHDITIRGSLRETSGKFHMGGAKLTVTGDISNSRGTFYVGGGSVLINGNLYGGGSFYVGGGSVLVGGSLQQGVGNIVLGGGTLDVAGDYRIQGKNSDGSYAYCEGALVMKDDADRVTVGGDFYPSGYSSYYYEEGSRVDGDVFTAGVLKIGGSLYQSKRSGSFCSSGTHRVVLTGTGERTILISSPDSHVNSLYVPDEISLTWEGYLNMDKPEVDLEVKASENGLSLYRNGFDDGVMDFNGHDITIRGSLRETSGKFHMGGAKLTVTGDVSNSRGTFYVGGGSVLVGGSLQQGVGNIVLGGGTLDVAGDYRIQGKNSDGSYAYCEGALVMKDDADRVTVGGDFYPSGYSSYYYEEGSRVDGDVFTAGVLKIGGSLYQSKRSGSFCSSGTHRVVLTGTGERTILISSPDSHVNSLYVPDEISLTWEGYLNMDKPEVDLEVKASENGLSLYRNGFDDGVMDFNGHDITIRGSLRETSGKFHMGGAKLTVTGDVSNSRGTFYVGGGSVLVGGSLQQGVGNIVLGGGTLDVAGDYRIQGKNSDGSYAYCEGALVMKDDADRVTVGGDFYPSGYSSYYYEEGSRVDGDVFTAGVLKIGGSLYQSKRSGSFCSSGTHRVVLTGTGERTILISSPDSHVNSLYVPDEISLTWEGYLNMDKPEVDLEVKASENGLSLYRNGFDDGVMDFNGHDITIRGSLRETSGKFHMGGAKLTVTGDVSNSRGTFYVGGGSVLVGGSLQQGVGNIVLGGGTLDVAGDYRIQGKNSDGSYAYCEGALVMKDDADRVTVGGDFYPSGYSSYYYEEGSRVDGDVFTAGVLKIGGSLYQSKRSGSFCSSGTHRVVLTGTGERTILISSPDSHVNSLYVPDEISLTWEGYLNMDKPEVDLEVKASENGLSLYRNGFDDGVMDFNGHDITIRGSLRETSGKFHMGGAKLTVTGDVSNSRGTFYVGGGSVLVGGSLQQGDGDIILGGGTLDVAGDYRIQRKNSDGSWYYSNGALVMTDDADRVKVGGDFYASGDNYYYNENNEHISDVLSAGVMEVCGNFTQCYNSDAFRAMGTHKLILSGTGNRTVSFENTLSSINSLEVGSGITLTWKGSCNLAKLESDLTINVSGDDGISLTGGGTGLNLNGHNFIIKGDVRGTYGSIDLDGMSLSIEGSCENSCASFALKGGVLAINGRFEQTGGNITFRNGTMTVSGDYQQEGGSVFLHGGTLEVDGDYRIQSFDSEGNVWSSDGTLVMRHPEDHVIVKGSFYNDGDSYIYDDNDDYMEELWNAGILEVGGDFYSWAYTHGTGTHKVILNGTQTQVVYFENEYAGFHLLEIAQEPGKYIFNRIPCWDTVLRNGNTFDKSVFGDFGVRIIKDNGEQYAVLSGYYGDQKNIVIPGSFGTYQLRKIADEVFYGNSSINKVTIPEGVTIIGCEAFENCNNLREVSLPESLITIERGAFESCSSLREVSLPEGLITIGAYAFEECENLEEITIPESVTEIGYSAFNSCTALRSIEIPTGITVMENGIVSYCTSLESLTIPASVTSIRSLYGLDKEKVVFFVEPGSYAEEYAIENGYLYEIILNTSRTITAIVQDPDGNVIEDGFSIYWYDSNSGKYLAAGTELRNAKEGRDYICSILLDKALSELYLDPDNLTITVGDKDETVKIILERIGRLTVKGNVRDEDGKAVIGATAKLRQTYPGGSEKSLEAFTGEDGSFIFDAAKTSSTLIITADGYYNAYYSISPAAGEDEINYDVVLRKVPANRITLSLTRQNAVEPGEVKSETTLNSLEGIDITAYNETSGKEITDLTVQYPYIYLGDGSANPNDRIRFSMTDRTDTLTASDAVLTLDENCCGSLEWTFIQNGMIRIRNIKGSEEKTIMIFAADGSCKETKTTTTSYLGSPLPQGTYTCVLLQKSQLLRSIDSYDRLEQFGLRRDTDYLERIITVKKGEIAVLSNLSVPVLDENRLYYTDEVGTRFSASSSSVTTGQYVTIRASYRIQDKYESSSESVQIEIPDGMSLVEGSLTVNGKTSPYAVNDGKVTVQVNTKSGTVRFYVLPANADTYRMHAELSFVLGNKTITQPIGAVQVTASAAAITVPEKTSSTKVTASGKTAAGCEITVYDNGTAVGTTTSRKNGAWSLEFELVKPRTYSVHHIQALVRNSAAGQDIETQPATLIYNKNFTQVSRVTMINTSYPANETRTVFDFLHPAASAQSYDYYPSYSRFTFLVEFTGSSDWLKNVQVLTRDSSGELTYVTCSYDSVDQIWVGTHDYSNFSEIPCGVAVSCDNATAVSYEASMEPSDYENLLLDTINFDTDLSARLQETAVLQNEEINDSTYSFDMVVNGHSAGYTMEILDYSKFDLASWEADNCQQIEYEDGTICYQHIESDEYTYSVYTACPKDSILYRETISLANAWNETTETNASSASSSSSVENVSTSRDESLTETVSESGIESVSVQAANASASDIAYDIAGFVDPFGVQDTLTEWAKLYEQHIQLDGNVEILKDKLSFLKQLLNKQKGGHQCKCVGPDPDLSFFSGMIDEYKRQSESRFKGLLLANGFLTAARFLKLGNVSKLKGKAAEAYKLNKQLDETFQWEKRMTGKGKIKYATDKELKRDAWAETIFEEYYLPIPTDAQGWADKAASWASLANKIARITEDNESQFQNLYSQMDAAMEQIVNNRCKCDHCTCNEEDPDDPDDPHDYDVPDLPNPTIYDVTPQLDPSGYVYEAVPSNRVEGVESSIYYYDYAIDDFGMKEDEKSEIFWDAENYDQINPQVTNTRGIFGWDVPQGQWVVKFSKDGYNNADSYHDPAVDAEGYLPVPPIQTEVNTAIVSKAAPTVANVLAYPEQVRIDFSQYMQIDTVNASNVKVSFGGKSVAGTIEPLNAEDNYDGTAQYASSFAFTPSKPDDKLSGTVTVSVEGVVNYCGKAISAAYSGEHAVTFMPKELEVSGAEEIVHHESEDLEIRILPAEAGSGKSVTVTSFSPSIVSVQTQTVNLDENGRASVELQGKLPGQGVLVISLDGTDLSTEKQVFVKSASAAAIVSLDTLKDRLSISSDGCVFTGSEICPAVTIEGLTEGTDFTVSYSNNINAGTAAVTVTGQGGYTGTLTESFKICQASVSGLNVTGINDKTYTGTAQTQSPVVKHGSTILKDGTDYTVTYNNNINAGTASLTINGKGNYTGSVNRTFKISPASVSGLNITGINDKTYTGTAQTQSPVVKHGSTTLKYGTDYTVTYKNNINAGTASLTINGKGNYTGSVNRTFKISPADQQLAVKESSSKIAVGKTATLSITGAKGKISFNTSNKAIATVDKNGKVKAVKVGTIKITVTADTDKTKNYNIASKTVTLKVVPGATTSLTAQNQKKGIRLTWKKVTGAAGYKFYRGKKLLKKISGGSKTTYTDTAANKNGTKYTYKVVAYASTGDSTLSKSLTACFVSQPAVNKLSNAKGLKANVEWAQNKMAAGYEIQYGLKKNFSGAKTVTIKKKSTVKKTLTKLLKGKTYYVRIRTYKTVGKTKHYSAWSAAKTVKITK